MMSQDLAFRIFRGQPYSKPKLSKTRHQSHWLDAERRSWNLKVHVQIPLEVTNFSLALAVLETKLFQSGNYKKTF